MKRLLIAAVLTIGFWVLCFLLAPGVEAAPKSTTTPRTRAQAAIAVKSRAESLGPVGVKRFPGITQASDAIADWRIVNSAYFSNVGLALLKGRNFAAADSKEAPRVTIVDENLAQRLWPGQDAVGRRLRVEGEDSPWMTVVGVVKHHSGGALEASTHGQLYFPYPETGTDDDSIADEKRVRDFDM